MSPMPRPWSSCRPRAILMRRTGPGLVGVRTTPDRADASPARIARPVRTAVCGAFCLTSSGGFIKNLAGYIKRPREVAWLCRPDRHGHHAARALSEHVMSDLDPAAIETLLQEGARRRGIPVNAYHDVVRAKTDIAGISFATALQVTSAIEKMSSGKAWFEQLAILERQAERYRMSVTRFGQDHAWPRGRKIAHPTLICQPATILPFSSN